MLSVRRAIGLNCSARGELRYRVQGWQLHPCSYFPCLDCRFHILWHRIYDSLSGGSLGWWTHQRSFVLVLKLCFLLTNILSVTVLSWLQSIRRTPHWRRVIYMTMWSKEVLLHNFLLARSASNFSVLPHELSLLGQLPAGDYESDLQRFVQRVFILIGGTLYDLIHFHSHWEFFSSSVCSTVGSCPLQT